MKLITQVSTEHQRIHQILTYEEQPMPLRNASLIIHLFPSLT